MHVDYLNSGMCLCGHISLIPYPNDAGSSKMKINRHRCPCARQHGMLSSSCDFLNILIKLVKDIHESVQLSYGAQYSNNLGCGLAAPMLLYQRPPSFWIIEVVCSSR